jgi:hypothetical protein
MEIQFPRAPLPLFDDLTDHVLVAVILPPFENAHDIVVRLHALVDPRCELGEPRFASWWEAEKVIGFGVNACLVVRLDIVQRDKSSCHGCASAQVQGAFANCKPIACNMYNAHLAHATSSLIRGAENKSCVI